MGPANPFTATPTAHRYSRGRPYHHARTLRRALAEAGVPRPAAALDVACGTGLSTQALRELRIPAVGVDVVPAMAAVARAGTGLPYAVAAAEALPVRDGSVDLVTVGSGVHWFEPDRFRAEAARVLRPGGTLLLYEHAGPDLLDRPGFRDWTRGSYLARYPSPARGAMAADADAGGRFDRRRTGRWPDEVPFTREAFADYLMTQSNVVRVLDAGEPADSVRDWLLAELAPFFAGGPTQVVTFTASYQALRKIRH